MSGVKLFLFTAGLGIGWKWYQWELTFIDWKSKMSSWVWPSLTGIEVYPIELTSTDYNSNISSWQLASID